MSKLYEVLENASREREKFKTGRAEEPAFEPHHSRKDAESIRLYQSIDAALRGNGSRVVQFIGTRMGEGCSTIVRDLATTAAVKLSESVLLIDLDRPFHEGAFMSATALPYHFERALSEQLPLEKTLRQVEQTSLYITSLSPKPNTPPADSESDYSDLWGHLKDRFSLILIDSPPVNVSPVGFSLLRKVDGVVLVIRAEQTRWPVAVTLKDRITAEGGKIIGAVYNDRRYYIPQWLYKYL